MLRRLPRTSGSSRPSYFADLVGSTALAGSQDPERTRATLDRFYDAMAAEIERAGGTVEKFAGDAVIGTPRRRATCSRRKIGACAAGSTARSSC
jgi:class 3 adenylate cyclase